MISQSEQLRHFSSNYLNLIILPTEACNFRCTYCYETFENKKMPRPVVTGIKSLINRRGEDLDRLDISWFGGEPLLALDVITEITKHALDVAKTDGFTFHSGMTTNGDSCNDIGWISENGEVCVDQKKYQRWIAPLVEADWPNVGCPLPSVMQQAEPDDAH
jgi:sulfatase maturation enzyme AslB (radical SAM superfamily)